MENQITDNNATEKQLHKLPSLMSHIWVRFKLLFKMPDTQDAPPVWLILLCEAGLLLMLNQIRLPIAGGRIAISDIAFLVSIIPLFVWLIIRRRHVFYPIICGVAALLCFCVTNLASMSGYAGAFKCAQMVQYLLCGVMMMSFLLENVPGTTVFTVLLALALNVLMTFFQAGAFGVDSMLAPADIMALPWGIGNAFSGLFRSRMALSFFTGVSLAWLYPQLIGKSNSLIRTVLAIAITVPCLLAIVHGQMLLLVVLVLLVEGYAFSKRAGHAVLISILLALLASTAFVQLKHPQTVLATLSPIKSGQYTGELKTNHIDFIAAIKMAAANPCAGVGSGHYQEKIGTFYGELPKPPYNDIETDTQASWGIIAGTAGVTTAAFMALLLIVSMGNGLSRTHYGENRRDPLALGGAAALGLTMLAMFITDPFTRGLAWMPVLAISSAIVPRPKEDFDDKFILMPGYALMICLLLGLLISVNAILRVSKETSLCAPEKQPTATENIENTQAKPETAAKPAAVPIVPMLNTRMALVLNADSVSHFTPPFKQSSMRGTASSKILEVPDNAGKPPEGKEPSMEYGGAVFQLDVPTDDNYKIWLNVWWEGSCGNTLSIMVGDEKKSITVGNDSAYEKWHWVEVPRVYQLRKGTYPIAILNREDGIKLDQILVTSDLKYVPQGKEK